jgi:hypothetical protein
MLELTTRTPGVYLRIRRKQSAMSQTKEQVNFAGENVMN